MDKEFNVFAIQHHPEELDIILSNLSENGNIIYSNLKCDIKVGTSKLRNRQFDTIIYDEENKNLVYLLKNGEINKEMLLKKLEDLNKNYVEISFDYKMLDYKNDDNLPELCFVKDRIELLKCLQDSVKKGEIFCEYYPNIKSYIDFGYLSKSNEYRNLFSKYYKSLIKLNDKIILLHDSGYIHNKDFNKFLDNRIIIKTIKHFGLFLDIIENKEPNLYVEGYKRKLELRKRNTQWEIKNI